MEAVTHVTGEINDTLAGQDFADFESVDHTVIGLGEHPPAANASPNTTGC